MRVVLRGLAVHPPMLAPGGPIGAELKGQGEKASHHKASVWGAIFTKPPEK